MIHSQSAISPDLHAQAPRGVLSRQSRLDQLLPGCSELLSQACREVADLVPYRVRQALNQALTPALTTTIAASLLTLPRAEHTYTRHVLHADPKGRYTVAALIWEAGHFSPVHAHFTWCAYRVLSGALRETHYAWDQAAGHAYPLNHIERIAGHSACSHAGLDFIHQLGHAGQEGAQPAVSLHVYGIDSERIGTHVNRALASLRRLD